MKIIRVLTAVPSHGRPTIQPLLENLETEFPKVLEALRCQDRRT